MMDEYTTSWGNQFTVIAIEGTPKPDNQAAVDAFAVKMGVRPPFRRWQQTDDGPVLRWPSVMCQSGSRQYCTCDTCF